MDEKLPKRRRLRLAQYDYATPGAYFVTICTRGKECVFGHVDDPVIEDNPGRWRDDELYSER